MTTEFFKEQLRIAEVKREQELTLLSHKVKSKNTVLKEFSKPIGDFLDYINENYSFNEDTHYTHDKKLFNDPFIIKDDITYFTKKLLNINGRDYLTISINDDLSGEISMSHNTTSNFIRFVSPNCVQLFIEYYCAEIVKVGIKNTINNERTKETMCECGQGIAKTFNVVTSGVYCDDCITWLEEEGLY